MAVVPHSKKTLDNPAPSRIDTMMCFVRELHNHRLHGENLFGKEKLRLRGFQNFLKGEFLVDFSQKETFRCHLDDAHFGDDEDPLHLWL